MRSLAAWAWTAALAVATAPGHAHGPTHAVALPKAHVSAGTPLVLTDQRGQPYTMTRADGRYTLLTFGFTACSATCPVSLQVASEVLKRMPREHAPVVAFVTLDPLGDTAATLGRYVAQFHPDIVGLTGSPDTIAAAVEIFRVGVRPSNKSGPDHSAVWYLLDPQGRVVRVFPFAASPADLIEGLAKASAAVPGPLARH